MSLRRPLVVTVISVAAILGFGLSATGNSAQLLAKQADDHVARKEYSQAIRLYNESLAARPDQPDVRQRLVDLYLLKNRPGNAKAILDAWSAIDPSDPRPHVSFGGILESQGQLNGALERFQTALELDPRQREARHRLGDLQLRQGSLDRARVEFETLLASDGGDQRAHFRLGQILAGDDHPQAIAHLRHATDLKTDPSISGQSEELLDTLSEGGDRPYVAAALGRAFLKTRDVALARRQFEEATRLDSHYADAFAYLGYTWLLLRRPDLAGQPLEKAVGLSPASPFGHHILGNALRAQGRVREAIEAMEKAAELSPTDPFLLSDLALTHVMANDVDAAERNYVRVASLARTDPMFVGQLAHFYLDRLFKIQEGLSVARRLVELRPGNGEDLDLLGWALYLNGQTDDAEKTLNEALKQAPYLASAHYHLAVLWQESGQTDRARISFERAADLDLSGSIEKRAGAALEELGTNG